MTKKFKTAVVIGRFQIFHNGHKGMIDHALSLADRVLVLIGSAQINDDTRSDKNPFTWLERAEMISETYKDTGAALAINCVDDHPGDNAAWCVEVQAKIDNFNIAYGGASDKQVVIVGHKKDESSFYLDLFPQFAFEAHEAVYDLNSTDLRAAYFGNPADYEKVHRSVPEAVFVWLMLWTSPDDVNDPFAPMTERYKPHPCPYREEIFGDSATLCTCDPAQMHECAMDV